LTLGYFHGNFLSFLKTFESLHLDRAVVDKYILSAFSLNESKSFIVVEPFYGSGHSFACHNYLVKKLASRSQRLLKPAPTQAGVILLAKVLRGPFFWLVAVENFTKPVEKSAD
jgi:hypothetical protein